MSIANFNLTYLTPLLETLNKEDKLCFLMGDFSIDLMKMDSKLDNSKFYNIMCSYFFSRIILQPTRVIEKSKTLIHNIFFNSFEFTTISGNITHSISDHMIQFVILEDFIKLSSPCKSNTYKRNFKSFDRNKLKEDLYKIDWDKVIHENDNNINNAFNGFYKTLTEILDHHTPLIEITKKERTLHLKPWINKVIQYLMWKRDKLFRKYCTCKDLIQKNIIHNECKRLRNIVTYETRKSKKDYFKNYFEKNKNDTSLIWKGIRQLITLKHKSKRQPSITTVKGKDVTNPKNIVNAFNNFFTNIGPSLSKIILQSKKNFKNFLNNPSLNSFVLKPVTHDEVRKLISQLNNRKALGPASIPVTILKDNIDVLVRPLTLFLNQSFEQGIFPVILKIAQVSPIHKKEDTVIVSNYPSPLYICIICI